MDPVTALTIAGSDSGGGAGIQADLRTFSAHRVHGTSALTAVTAQNTLGVTHVEVMTTTSVLAQIEAVLGDFAVRAVKTGMLATPSLVELVAAVAASGRLPQLVVDPVLISTSNHTLLAEGGVEAYRHALLPHAFLVTPNLREAAALAEVDANDITTVDDLVTLGRLLLAFGANAVLVKGGHLSGERSPDVLVSATDVTILDGPRVVSTNTHGTGCTLSAAIAANLASGHSLQTACEEAKTYVTSAIATSAAWRLGRGAGPLDHLGWGHELP